ncbi:MAG TPA: ABC transporter permease [Mycobacteriales bacterium]|nr:ABC transporter permease [Mycobacteriales bacterium]
MSIWDQTWTWLTTASHWTGSDGVTGRVAQHLELTAEAVLLAAVVALPVGIALGHFGRGGVLAVNIANVGRAIPTLAVLVLLVLALGLGNAPVIYALALFAAPPMLTNSYLGMSGVDAEIKDAARGTGLSAWQSVRRIEVPLAIPLIAAGVRTATVQVVATATIAALVGSGGLGRFVVDGFQTNDYGQLVGGALLVGLLAVVVEIALGWLEGALTPGRRHLAGTSSPASIDPSMTLPAGASGQAQRSS